LNKTESSLKNCKGFDQKSGNIGRVAKMDRFGQKDRVGLKKLARKRLAQA